MELFGQLLDQVLDLAAGDALGLRLEHRVRGVSRALLVDSRAVGHPSHELLERHDVRGALLASTIPRFSWPNTMPGAAAVRPSYMCRSEPQMAVEVTRTMTSLGCSIRGSGTSSTATLNGPL